MQCSGNHVKVVWGASLRQMLTWDAQKNPNSPMYTNLGVLTKGTIIEINVSELGMTTAGGKVVWGRYVIFCCRLHETVLT